MTKKSNGFSLVQVMIMAGFLGGIAVLSTQLKDITTKTSTKFQFSNDTNMVVNDINSYLSDKNQCLLTLPTTTSTPLSIGKYISGTATAPPQGYGASRLVIEQFSFTPPATSPGTGTLKIVFKNREILKDPPNLTKKINIAVEFSGSTITTCRSANNSTVTDIWSRLGSTDINFSSGKIGIGKNDPLATLDILNEIKIGSTSALCNTSHPESEGMQRYNPTLDIMEYCVPSKGWITFCPEAVGQIHFTSSNYSETHSWTVPSGVTSISVVGVSRGESGGANDNGDSTYTFWGGTGGNLAYRNEFPVSPGQTYGIQASKGLMYLSIPPYTLIVDASNFVLGQTKFLGGHGSHGTGVSGKGSGGGAAGYAGKGGDANAYGIGQDGQGGGGGGGGGDNAGNFGGSGGGVGIYGIGANGVGGLSAGAYGGHGGSGGSNGDVYPIKGGNYGGGGTLDTSDGAVRIIWPGSKRKFPSTNTIDMTHL